MKRILILLVASFSLAPCAQAQDDSVAPVEIRDYGKFNYAYFRLAFLRPTGAFSDPLSTAEFPGKAQFRSGEEIRNNLLTLGLESGRVRHFNKIPLGTPMLRAGINSGFALHAFGPGEVYGEDFDISTNGSYILRLGLGPQVTFKPLEEVRIGLYYRLGIGAVYSSYFHAEYIGNHTHELNIQAINYAYNGDLGLDITYGMLNVGLSFSHMRSYLENGQIFNIGDVDAATNAYYHYDEGSESAPAPVNPLLRWNRIAISVGLTF